MSSCTVGVVSDTHGHLDHRVAAVIAECDIAVHAGDVGAAAVLQGLRPRSGKVVVVAGNNDIHDKWPSQDHALLHSLPQSARIELPGGTLVIVHGDRVTPAGRRHARLRELFPEARAVVYGHSHRLCEDLNATPWVLNPGAAGRTRTYGGPTCMVVHASSLCWEVRAVRFELAPRNRRTG